MQKYPRGSRGSPAKGVVWETVARVRIPPSAPKNGTPTGVPFFGVGVGENARIIEGSREVRPNILSRGNSENKTAHRRFADRQNILLRPRQVFRFLALRGKNTYIIYPFYLIALSVSLIIVPFFLG